MTLRHLLPYMQTYPPFALSKVFSDLPAHRLVDVLAEGRVPSDPEHTHTDTLTSHNTHMSVGVCVRSSAFMVGVCCLSPWVSEGLVTGEALRRVFLHQTADKVFGCEKQNSCSHSSHHTQTVNSQCNVSHTPWPVY